MMTDSVRPRVKIKIVGVGGAGISAVNQMIASRVEGVEFAVIDTDTKVLNGSTALTKLQIGRGQTIELGYCPTSETGRASALEDSSKIIEVLEGADMIFVVAGLGGGTGTGALPTIASLASELGALVIAVVTTPVSIEPPKVQQRVPEGLAELKDCVDMVIAIPNQQLLVIAERGTSLRAVYKTATDVVRQAVQAISDLVTLSGEVKVDFADVRLSMEGKGLARMGTGRASGERRALEAAQSAISSPLLGGASIEGAKSVLVNITGGSDLTLFEVSEAATHIQACVGKDVDIVFGTVINENIQDEVRVTVIATGFP